MCRSKCILYNSPTCKFPFISIGGGHFVLMISVFIIEVKENKIEIKDIVVSGNLPLRISLMPVTCMMFHKMHVVLLYFIAMMIWWFPFRCMRFVFPYYPELLQILPRFHTERECLYVDEIFITGCTGSCKLPVQPAMTISSK